MCSSAGNQTASLLPLDAPLADGNVSDTTTQAVQVRRVWTPLHATCTKHSAHAYVHMCRTQHPNDAPKQHDGPSKRGRHWLACLHVVHSRLCCAHARLLLVALQAVHVALEHGVHLPAHTRRLPQLTMQLQPQILPVSVSTPTPPTCPPLGAGVSATSFKSISTQQTCSSRWVRPAAHAMHWKPRCCCDGSRVPCHWAEVPPSPRASRRTF